eukprot:PhM_4_TR9990/c0_g1_i1/m.16228
MRRRDVCGVVDGVLRGLCGGALVVDGATIVRSGGRRLRVVVVVVVVVVVMVVMRLAGLRHLLRENTPCKPMKFCTVLGARQQPVCKAASRASQKSSSSTTNPRSVVRESLISSSVSLARALCHLVCISSCREHTKRRRGHILHMKRDQRIDIEDTGCLNLIAKIDGHDFFLLWVPVEPSTRWCEH